MNYLKVCFLYMHSIQDMKNSVFFSLFKENIKKKIKFVDKNNADVLIIGPYENLSIKKRLINSISDKKIIKDVKNFFNNLNFFTSKRKYKPLVVFLSYENVHLNAPIYDFSFFHDLGIFNNNHFRFPFWKEHIDWAHEDIIRDLTFAAKRFGGFWSLKDLMLPQGADFIKKKNICLISSHMREPRMSMYLKFKEHFRVDGYGPHFNQNIEHHDKSNFLVKDLLKSYAFNLCPENSLYPGYYTEKIPNAFLSKTLPISWADHNISLDFNKKAFINLLDYTKDNYEEICSLLKDINFLKKFTEEPLLLKPINLDGERKFINKIASYL